MLKKLKKIRMKNKKKFKVLKKLQITILINLTLFLIRKQIKNMENNGKNNKIKIIIKILKSNFHKLFPNKKQQF